MTRFVKIKKFTELTGYSRSSIDKLRARGEWREGSGEIVIKAPNGDILIDIKAFEEWVINGDSVLKRQGLQLSANRASKSASPTKKLDAEKGSSLSPPPLT